MACRIWPITRFPTVADKTRADTLEANEFRQKNCQFSEKYKPIQQASKNKSYRKIWTDTRYQGKT